MPFGVWGDRVSAQSQGPAYGSGQTLASYNPYNPGSQYMLGGGNPAFAGYGDTAVQKRRFADVGKVQLNLLDPTAQSRANVNYQPVDQAPDPISAIGNYFNPNTPGGAISGILGAVGQTVGGVLGEGGAKAGSQLGQFLGKIPEGPMGLVGGIGLPFIAPVIDSVNSEIEKYTPYILRNTLKIPKDLGGAFESVLNIFGAAGTAVQRTYAGLYRDLDPALQARVDSGQITEDQAFDELVLSNRAFTDDPIHNLALSILTDPANWASLGVGAVGGAVRGTAKIGMAFGGALRAAEEGSAIARLTEAGGQIGEVARAAKASEAVRSLITERGTLSQMRSAIDDNGAKLHLSLVERMGMSALGPVSDETGNTVARIGHYILKATDPVTFFSGSRAGQRSMQLLRTSSATGVMAALKPGVVNNLLDIADKVSSDGADRLLRSIGAWGGNALQEVGADELATTAMKDGAIPIFGTLHPTEATRQLIAGEAFDTNVGKLVEVHVERTKNITIGTLPYQEMYDQTIAKLASIFGVSPSEVARHVSKVDGDTAVAVHGMYYNAKGVELHTDVQTAMKAAADAGTLGKDIRPNEITMISPRTLTKQKLPDLVAALKTGDLDAIRAQIEKYDDFNWANRTSLPDNELKSQIQNWVDTNGGTLYDEITLRDPMGPDGWRADIPEELKQWAQDGETYGYGIGHGIPDDAPLSAHWRVTYKPDGTMANVNPRLDFWGDVGDPIKRMGRWSSMRMAATRSIRQERIVWQQRRRFITDMSHGAESHGIDIPPALSERLFQSLMYEAKAGYIQPRGMEPRQMMDAVRKVLDDAREHNSAEWDNLAGQITERQVVLGFLRAMQGDVSLVGVTQAVTGGIKAYAPGAAGNYWGLISERLYPLMRFTLNPVFQAMELTEPYILNAMRGIRTPLRRDSPGFRQGLATRNAVEQLIRNSDTPDGMIAETAEALAIGAYQKAEAQAKFGKRTWWGKIGMPGGNALLKNAAVGLEARRIIGDNLYAAFKAIKKEEFEAFWGDLMYEYRVSSNADVAERWLAQNLNLQDADGFRVGLVTDLMNHKNLGSRLRISKNGRPGVYTLADVEALIDNTAEYSGAASRKARGMKPGEALIEDLKSMTNEQWHAEADRVGIAGSRVGRISRSQADDIYRMANAIPVKVFWREYGKTFFQGVTGTTRPATRVARAQEKVMAREWVQRWAKVLDMTEEEYIALHADDIPRFTYTPPNPTTLSPNTMTDIRGDWVHEANLTGGLMIERAQSIKATHDANEIHPLDRYIDQAVAAIDPTDPREYLYGTPSIIRYDLAQAPNGSGHLLGYDSPLYRDPTQTIANTWEDGPVIRVRKDTLQLTDQGEGRFALNDALVTKQGHNLQVLTKNGWMDWDSVRRAGDIMEQRGPAVDPLVEAIYEGLPVKPGSEAGAALYKADLEALMPEMERQATGQYTGSSYEALNAWLRGHRTGANYLSERQLYDFRDSMDLSIQRGQLKEETELWRGINLASWKTAHHGKPEIDYMALEPGDKFWDPAFLSTSRQRGVAEDFAGASRDGVLIHMTMPAGTRANFMALHEIEDEIVLGRDRGFEVYKVVSRHDSGSTYHEIYVRPTSEEIPPGVLHMGMGDIPVEQRNAHRLVSDATNDPDEILRLIRLQDDPSLAQQARVKAQTAINRAKETGPPSEVTVHGGRAFGLTDPSSVVDDIEEAFDPQTARAHFEMFSDLRGRLQHLLETSHPDDTYTGGAIPSQIVNGNDLRVISSLAMTLPRMGMRAGLNHLFHVMTDVWNHGAKISEKGVAETASVVDRLDHQITSQLLRGGDKHVPFPWAEAATHDAQDVLLGNTTRGATGRVDRVMPIIADDAAAEGAGYMTRNTFQQIVEQHGVLDPETGYMRLVDESTAEVLYVDPKTLEYVKLGGETIRPPVDPVVTFRPGSIHDGQLRIPGNPVAVNTPWGPSIRGTFTEPEQGFVLGAGVIIREADGRVWIYEPLNHFGGYEHSWPKGGMDLNEDLQDAAMREAREEMGFSVKLTGYVGDFRNAEGTSLNRYYMAERTGGGPFLGDMSETAAIKLVTPEEARNLLLRDGKPDVRDQAILDAVEGLPLPAGAEAAPGPAFDIPEPELEVVSAPITLGETTFKRNLGGTTGAIQVEDARGRLYVEKQGASEAHINEEHYANDVYEAMGVPVPHQDIVQVGGANTMRSNFIEGGTPLNEFLRSAPEAEKEAIVWQLQQSFALDSLLANWDAIGLVGDNVIVKNGVAYRVDNGGSLRFRAQGAPKGERFGRTVGELETLRDPNLNQWGARIYGPVSDPDLRRQILDLHEMRQTIFDALPPELRPIVADRLEDMMRKTAHIEPSAETTVHVTSESRTPGFQTLTDYDHEYLTKFYNDAAAEMNARGVGGIKAWTAGHAAAMAGRMREELHGRPEGTVLDQAELDRATVELTPNIYPAPDSPIGHLTPTIKLLNQPRNRTQRHMFMSGVTHDTNRAIRDKFGLIVDDSDDAGIGVFDGTDQPMQSVRILDHPEMARSMADVMSYATKTPDMVTFIPDLLPHEIKAAGGDFGKYTARATITIPPSVGPRAADKLLLELGQKLPWGGRGMTSRTLPGGQRLVTVIDHDGSFPRVPGGEVDYDSLTNQLGETLHGIADAPDEALDLDVDYGSHHISGPARQEDGTYNWEAYGDAVHSELQAGGSTAGREALDGVRNAYEKSIDTHIYDVSPKNYDRAQRGEPPSHELEDKRGGQVLGTTTPGGITSSIIRGFGAADPLTGLHELVHMFSIAAQDPSLRDAVSRSWHDRVTQVEKHADNLDAAAAAATNKSVASRLRNDANAARAGIGTTDPAVWGKAQEEHLVEVLFEWIDKGVPINPDMRNVTEHFRNWIAVTRKDTKQRGMPPIHVSPAMEGVFNRMTMRKGAESVPYSIEDQALRMAGTQVVKNSWEEAHATQFYKRDRSMIERSINHPYIGLYPASYMWGKVLPEMVRFLALRPFGMETPFLAWNVLREVSDSVRAQQETDPSFKKFLGDNADAFLLASMFFPSLPQDTPANLSLPIRRIAEQGLDNQMKYAAGVDPSQVKDIDYAKGASDAMFYALGPAGTIRTVNQSLGMAGNLIRSGAGLAAGTLGSEEQQAQQVENVIPLR